MSAHTESLITTATQSRENAHAPYSNFRVGAALHATSGRTFGGARSGRRRRSTASSRCSRCPDRTVALPGHALTSPPHGPAMPARSVPLRPHLEPELTDLRQQARL